MKMYVMALLKPDPNRSDDPEESQRLQKAHMDNIKRLTEAGKLVLAGPNDNDLRGIYVFDVSTAEEAPALTETDPAIQSGSLVMQQIPWYDTVALMQVTELGKKLAKKSL